MDPSELEARQKYYFINNSTMIMPDIFDNADNYLPVSCLIISRICHAGMLTVDNLLTSSTSVPLRLLYNDLYDMFWNGYVTFAQLAITTQGKNSLTITNPSMAILNTFSNWDEALQSNPFKDIGQSFSSLFEGVSA